MEVRDRRRGDKGWQIAFRGRYDRDSVETLRGSIVRVERRRLLDEGEFWVDQLVGLRVVDSSGIDLGTVSGVEHGPQQDRLLIRSDAGDHAIPFVSELVPEVDVAGGRLVVEPIEGLFSGPQSQP